MRQAARCEKPEKLVLTLYRVPNEEIMPPPKQAETLTD